MVLRTFIDKNNTLISNSALNTGRNPVAELFYGGPEYENRYSRFLFHFDESRLKALYTGGTFTDLTKLKHTLHLKNTSSYDRSFLAKEFGSKARASSFDLILFKVTQPWDEGVGYDYAYESTLAGDAATNVSPSNWANARIGVEWSGGTGTYSGSSSGITIGTQHFDAGNEDLEIDITAYVNSLLTGNTVNHGLGIAFVRGLEQTYTTKHQYVGFFTRHTQSCYEPYVDTVYSNHIADDRHNFFLDKPNKLYLYVNLAGHPTNLDVKPSVVVYDAAGEVFSTITSSQVTHVTKGVYSINITVPTTEDNVVNTMFNDVWSGITIGGVVRPVVSLEFALKDSADYYNIGDTDGIPKRIGVSVSGIKSKEKIKRGDLRKVLVSARIPYTVNQTQLVDGMKYRLYTTEGKNEMTIVDYQPLEMTNNHNYFLVDTDSLLPNIYYLDIQLTSNQEVTTMKDVLSFDIVSEVNLRKS